MSGSRTGAILSTVLMLTRRMQLDKTREFYEKGIGLPVMAAAPDFVEFDVGGVSLRCLAVDREADVTTGYSPLLQLTVTDLDTTIQRVMMLGAHLDGPIRYPLHGKIAALRAPDGHMLALYEPSGDVTAMQAAAFTEALASVQSEGRE